VELLSLPLSLSLSLARSNLRRHFAFPPRNRDESVLAIKIARLIFSWAAKTKRRKINKRMQIAPTSVLFASESPMGCVVLEQNCLSGLPGEVAAEPSKANLRHFGERGVPWLSLHISICKQGARRGLENVIFARTPPISTQNFLICV